MINRKQKYQCQLIFDGNSLSNKLGNGADGFYTFPLSCCSTLRTNGKIFAQNYYPISGKTTTQLILDFPTKIAPYLRPKDIVFIWEITNDLKVNSLTAQQAYDNIVTYCGLVRALGCRVVVGGFIARDLTGDSIDLCDIGFACNTLISSNYISFADGWVDIGANAAFDSKADASNATYYLSDKIHLTTVGLDLAASIVAPVIQTLL